MTREELNTHLLYGIMSTLVDIELILIDKNKGELWDRVDTLAKESIEQLESLLDGINALEDKEK